MKQRSNSIRTQNPYNNNQANEGKLKQRKSFNCNYKSDIYDGNQINNNEDMISTNSHLSHNFTVSVRVKPNLSSQHQIQYIKKLPKQTSLNYSSTDSQSLILQYPPTYTHSYASTKNRKFKFDNIFIDQTNKSIYQNLIKPKISKLKQNFNLTLLTYGITGSGKTHTIFGNKELMEEGIATMCFRDILKQQAEFNKNQNVFSFSYMQIYNQQVHDLLATDINQQNNTNNQFTETKLKSLTLMQDSNGKVKIPQLLKISVNCIQQIQQLISKGNSIRVCSSNHINKLSSRSHALLQLYCYNQKTKIQNTVTIIDLAGSQKYVSILGNKQNRSKDKLISKQSKNLQKQGSNINRSLLALGNCLKGLENGQNHIPYRDSKLTRILKQDLSGRAHNIMIACVGRNFSQVQQTVNTLQYASRAANIKVEKFTNQSQNHSYQCQNCFKRAPWNVIISKMPQKYLQKMHFTDSMTSKNFNKKEKVSNLQLNLRFQIQISQMFNKFKQQILSFFQQSLQTQRSQYQNTKQKYICENLFKDSLWPNNKTLNLIENKNIDVAVTDIFYNYEKMINQVYDRKINQLINFSQINNTMSLKGHNKIQKVKKMEPQVQQICESQDNQFITAYEDIDNKTKNNTYKGIQLQNLIQNCNLDSFRQQLNQQKFQTGSNLRKKLSIKNNRSNLLSANTANSTIISDLGTFNSSFDRSSLYAQKTQRMNPDIDRQLTEYQSNKDLIIKKLRQAKNKHATDLSHTHQNISRIQFDSEPGPRLSQNNQVKIKDNNQYRVHKRPQIYISSFQDNDTEVQNQHDQFTVY